MNAFLTLSMTLLVSVGAFAQNHIDLRGREWKRLDQAPRSNSAGAAALCPGSICTGSSAGYTWANADEVSELISDFGSGDSFIATMGHTYMFVTTYTYDIGTEGLTSSVDPTSGLPIVAFAASGHASVTAYDDLGIGPAQDTFRPLFLYKTPPPPPPADCSLNGQPILHGASSTPVFQSLTVPDGQTCVSEVRTCTNGILSGSFTEASCSVLPPVVQPPACIKWEEKKGKTVCKKYANEKGKSKKDDDK